MYGLGESPTSPNRAGEKGLPSSPSSSFFFSFWLTGDKVEGRRGGGRRGKTKLWRFPWSISQLFWRQNFLLLLRLKGREELNMTPAVQESRFDYLAHMQRFHVYERKKVPFYYAMLANFA